MIYVTDTAEYDFTDYFSNIVKTASYEDMPATRFTEQKVIGRDGIFQFKDGYANKNIDVQLTLKNNVSIRQRRLAMREIKEILKESGYIILDYENDVQYKVKILNAITTQFNGTYDVINIPLECYPFAFNRISEDLAWEDADVAWASAEFTWAGTELTTTFDVGTHTITNRGNETSKPIWKITGAGTVTVGTQSFTVTEACDIDSDKMVVYSGSTNKIASFTGDFIELDTGESTLVTDVALTVENKDRWV